MIVSLLYMSIISGVIAAMEIPTLLKRKLTKELWVFCILLLIATVMGVVYGAGIDIPTPLNVIWNFFKPMTDFLEKYTGIKF